MNQTPPPSSDETTALLDGKSSLDGSLKDRVVNKALFFFLSFFLSVFIFFLSFVL